MRFMAVLLLAALACGLVCAGEYGSCPELNLTALLPSGLALDVRALLHPSLASSAETVPPSRVRGPLPSPLGAAHGDLPPAGQREPGAPDWPGLAP